MAGPSGRQTKMTIDLGGEQVDLERIRCTEELGRPYVIDLDIIATLGEVDILPHLGKPVHLETYDDDVFQRHFHGVLANGTFVKESASGFHYNLKLVPWSYYLSRNKDYAIFQEVDVKTIIDEVFKAAGISDFKFNLKKTYKKRNYCVQYGESDFDFVTRLMEEEGIYYYYEHLADKHIMIICDGPLCHKPATPNKLEYKSTSVTVFNTDSEERNAPNKYIQKWTEKVQSNSRAKITLRDFNFEKADKVVEAVVEADSIHPNDKSEIFIYPGNYVTEKDGAAIGSAMLDEFRANRQTFSGQSQVSSLECGRKLKINAHPQDRYNSEYLIIKTSHSIVSETYRSGDNDDEDPFNVEIVAIPADVSYKPKRTVPRPVTNGLESAIVTGPEGEEIWTDKYGRIMVRFHWDRSDSPGEKSTCWIRVSQTGGLGNIILPRVSHEVLVDFLNGDPDRPIVVGRLFNSTHMPTYPLPENKTRAVWRTKRYGETGTYENAKALDSGAPGANEIRFEDNGGGEEMYIHAERDMNARVRHSETHNVGVNQAVDVGYNQDVSVGNDRSKTVTNNEKADIGVNRTVTVGTADKLDVGETIEITAGTSIELKVGGSSIKIDATSITLSSQNIKIEAKAKLTTNGAQATHSASGPMTIKGAIVKIN
jgi:type VI secretion system secreted protein VgrG